MKTSLKKLVEEGGSLYVKAMQGRETEHLASALNREFLLEYRTWINSVRQSMGEKDLLDTDLFDEYRGTSFDINTPTQTVSSVNGELIGSFTSISRIDEFIKLISDQVKFLKTVKEQKPLTYDFDTHVINFMGKEIQISQTADTNPIKLLDVIFTKPHKIWATDEILDIWFGSQNLIDLENAVKAKSTYHAGKKINGEIEKKTGISDFLDVTTKMVKVNPKYL